MINVDGNTRNNDSVGTTDNFIDNSGVVDQQVICSHPCADNNCKYHPIAAPIDGTECRYTDCYGKDECKQKYYLGGY